MNVQTHLSGQISGQVPNQPGNQLSGLAQHNGNTFHLPMQNLGAQNGPSSIEAERLFIQQKIYEMLTVRQPPQTEASVRKIEDISKRLEDGIYRTSRSMEDYLNLDTLEARLHHIVKRSSASNQLARQSQFVNTSTPLGTMIPTPALQQSGNQLREASQLGVSQVRKTLDGLVHASLCHSPRCLNPYCRKVKGLFNHGVQCRTGSSGHCVLCENMWYLLQLHSSACNESECRVPKCREVKEELRRLG